MNIKNLVKGRNLWFIKCRDARLLALVFITACLPKWSFAHWVGDTLLLRNNGILVTSYKVIASPRSNEFVYTDNHQKCRMLIGIPQSSEPPRAWRSAGMLSVASVAAIGILFAMPPNVTNWNKQTLTLRSVGYSWYTHVSNPPVIDKDNWVLNWIMHPYFGAVYYMTFRGAGYKWWQSALFSGAMSTFFWEYGLEALAEKPSTQDLIVTPVVGSLVGEAFFGAKTRIKANGDKVLGSRVLGRTTLVLLDPLNELQDAIRKHKVKRQFCPDLKFDTNLSFAPQQGMALGVKMSW